MKYFTQRMTHVLFLSLHPANERRRYFVMTSLIGANRESALYMYIHGAMPSFQTDSKLWLPVTYNLD